RGLQVGALPAQREISADRGVLGVNLLVKRVHQRGSGCLLLLHCGAGRLDCEGLHVHSGYRSITFGTLKNTPSEAGALRMAISCGREGRSSSGRMAPLSSCETP